jgi:hypothetical protein
VIGRNNAARDVGREYMCNANLKRRRRATEHDLCSRIWEGFKHGEVRFV